MLGNKKFVYIFGFRIYVVMYTVHDLYKKIYIKSLVFSADIINQNATYSDLTKYYED